MNEVSALQHEPRGEHPLSALWHRISGRSSDFASEEELARRQILQHSFAAQYDASISALYQIAQSDLATRDISRSAIWATPNRNTFAFSRVPDLHPGG